MRFAVQDMRLVQTQRHCFSNVVTWLRACVSLTFEGKDSSAMSSLGCYKGEGWRSDGVTRVCNAGGFTEQLC